MSPVIRFENVSKHFRRRKAVDDLSLQVPAGSVFALLGENGAGKTTAIRMLLGLLRPTSGQIEVLGRDPARDGLELRRRVGYVPDSPVLYDWMTVAEIGWFAAGFYDHPAAFQEYFRQLAESFELSLPSRMSTLSKGMQAKVALALALAPRPQLLVMDEPTAGLDPIVRREFLESMIDVAAEGRTVLLSSHQIADVERVADWVGVMRNGSLVCVERLEDLKEQIHELWIAVDHEAPPPAVGGAVLQCQRRGRQWRMLVRGPQPSELELLGAQAGVHKVEWRTPSLEEIFIALSRPSNAAGAAELAQVRKESPV